MTLKDPKKIIRNLFDKHAEKIDNVIYADKLFMINSIIYYLFKDKDYTKIDKQKLIEYGELISRFLKEEVDIFWENGTLMVRELDDDSRFEGG